LILALTIRTSFVNEFRNTIMEDQILHTKTLMKNLDQPLRLGDVDEKKPEKRDKLDLLLELLEATNEPTKKTHLIYRLRINYYQLTRYLDLLLKLDMVQEISSPFEGYAITEKGRVMRSLFNRI
jgi:predicted transcriptional regulator